MRETGDSQLKKKYIFHMRPFLAQKVHSVMFYCMSKMSLFLRLDVCQNLNNFPTPEGSGNVPEGSLKFLKVP